MKQEMAAISKQKPVRKRKCTKEAEKEEAVFPVGLEEHVEKLHEMVVWPLIYPCLFKRMGVTPAKGILFYGQPGTGKTMTARFLANTCNMFFEKTKQKKRVSFFVQNGSECLSRWVGESEKKLRTLFEEAKKKEPAIIFFDEIDGLAPRRNEKTEQSHVSVVSTLLSMMDGLCGRGEVVVIGATNRVDSLDPALRRTGRFDRELLFELPALETRRKMFQCFTEKWPNRLPGQLLQRLLVATSGFSGADIRGLCNEAVIAAIKRVRKSGDFRESDVLCVGEGDFQEAFREAAFSRGAGGQAPSLFRSVCANEKAPLYLAEKIVSVFYEEEGSWRGYYPRFLFCGESVGQALRRVLIHVSYLKKNISIRWLPHRPEKKELADILGELSCRQPSFLVVEDIERFFEFDTHTRSQLSYFYESLPSDSSVGLIASTRAKEKLCAETLQLLRVSGDEGDCGVFHVGDTKERKRSDIERRLSLLQSENRREGFESIFEEEDDSSFVQRLSVILHGFFQHSTSTEYSFHMSRTLPRIFAEHSRKEEIEKAILTTVNESKGRASSGTS
ncbi:MAG: uncharacterized protein A8A55_1152 [Amphiamblys sp. WSBS2006]|nr:MAG: uncharacterized protein A8A55_1152 [Amphiamblys sp. WSBS2006]